MAVRLSKVAREFNVGLSTIVEFLHSKGIKISSDPNAKLTEEDYSLVAKEFSTDSEVKKESTLVDLKNTRKKKETVTIDNAGNVSSENDEEEDEFISVKDEVKLENKIKVVDHIDLNPAHKVKPAEQTANTPPPVTAPAPQVEEEELPEAEKEETPVIEQEVAEIREEEAPAEPFKVSQPAIKEVKVVGSIDLDAINQRTRPPKKTRQEKERDRKEARKLQKPIPGGKTETGNAPEVQSEGGDSDTRKKRARILRQDEKVQLDVASTSAPAPGKNSKIEENKKKLKKLKKKKNEKKIVKR